MQRCHNRCIPCKCTAGLPLGDRHPVHPLSSTYKCLVVPIYINGTYIDGGKGPFDEVFEVSMPCMGGDRHFSSSEDRGYLMSQHDLHKEHIDGVTKILICLTFEVLNLY